MARKFDVVERIPMWAVDYFVNAETSALDEEDLKSVKDYEERLLRKGLRLTCPIEGTENEFCPYPAFGLACDTVDFYAERTRSEAKKKKQKPRRMKLVDLLSVQDGNTLIRVIDNCDQEVLVILYEDYASGDERVLCDAEPWLCHKVARITPGMSEDPIRPKVMLPTLYVDID